MGVIIPNVMKAPMCPYCYEGIVVVDKETGNLKCDSCIKMVLMESE